MDLTGDDIFFAAEPGYTPRIIRTKRVGVDYAGPRWAKGLLRFYIRGNAFVSKR